MVVICSRSAEVGRVLGGGVDGEKLFVGDVRRALAAAILRRPLAVLLHVRAGGNQQRAVDTIPAFAEWSPRTAIIVVTHSPSAAEIAEANQLGMYGYVDFDGGGCVERVREMLKILRRREDDRGPMAGGRAVGH